MQRPHLPSLALGVLSGTLLLFLAVGGAGWLGSGGPRFGQMAQGEAQNMARIAERLGMTEAQLQSELDSGKTMRELLEERSGSAGGRRFGSGALRASGATLSSPSSSSGSVSS